MPIANPNSLPGCMLWLDAADPSTLFQDVAGTISSTNNTPVSLWLDKSTKNNHFKFAGSAPLLSTIGMQNNLSAVCFNNTATKCLSGFVTNFRYLTGGATIFSVCQPLSAAAREYQSSVYWCAGNIGSAGSGYSANRAIGISSITGSFTNESITFSHESATATSGRLGSGAYRRYANTSESLTITVSPTGTVLYQNGRIVPLHLNSGITTTSNTSPSSTAIALNNDSIILNGLRANGVITPGPANNWLEFIIYDSVLSDADRIDVEDYIKTKWNLSDPIYNVYGAIDGPWTDPSTWLHNALPTTETDVYAWGKVIDVNTSVTVLSLRTEFLGGSFAINTPNVVITLTDEGIIPGTSTCVSSYLGGTDEFYIIGKIRGSNESNNCVGVTNNETGIIRCISPWGIRAGIKSGSHGATSGDTGVLFLTGPCYGSDIISNAYGVYIPYAGYVNIVGNIYAGLTSPGVAFNGAIDLNCTIRVTGNIYGSAGANGLLDTGGDTKSDIANINLCSSFRTGSTGYHAININKFLLYPKPYASFTKHLSSNNSPVIQYSAVDDYTIYLHPEAKDTALGVRYGALTLSGIPFQLEGTMGIPDRTAVSYNTPVSNTLGVGIVSVESLQSAWTAPSMSLKIKNTLGQRAHDTALISELGDLLSKVNI